MAVFRKRTHTPTPKKKDIPAGLWTKCPLDGEMVYTKDLEANWNVFPVSGYHERLSTKRRIALLIDEGTWKETDSKLVSKDPLKFTAGGSYPERLAQHQKKSGLRDSVICGHGLMDGLPVSLAIMDFSFMGASMGSVAGEKVTRHRARDQAEVPVRRRLRLWWRPHAGRHPFPDADGQDQRRPREAPRGRPALHRRPHQSHDGRRHGQLRDPR